AAAAYAAWSAWSWSKSGGVDKVALLGQAYAAGGVLAPLRQAAVNARWYLSDWGGGFLPPSRASGALALAVGAALGLLAARGLLRALRRRGDDPAAWVLLGAAALHALWGWQYERYLLPLLPLMLWALAEGLERAAAPALAVLLVLQLGAQTLPRLGRPSPWRTPELARTYAWLSARPRPALLSSAMFVRDGWWSGLPSAALPDAPDAAAFAAALKSERAAYVLRQDGLDVGMGGDPGSSLRRGLERDDAFLDDARYFRKVHEEPSEHAQIFVPR
ncbi:MAG: hypothetical protein KGM24_02455, partial [Elusimicrobia bacterium]|nr:hypothetical protein [Elusimicrobiota bacterium]